MHSLRKPMQVKDPVGDLAEKNAEAAQFKWHTIPDLGKVSEKKR